MARQDREKELAEMTAEELERLLRETFFYPDVIDDTVFRELEAIREALEKKRPVPFTRTPQESWAQFAEDHGEELASLDAPKADQAFLLGETEAGIAAVGEGSAQAQGSPGHSPSRSPGKRTGARLFPAILRRVLIAAVIAVLLAGVALAASPRLLVWVRGWSAAPAGDAVPGEDMAEKPIAAALEELGITEPVYPSYLPEGYVLTEVLINEDPLLLSELYTRGDRFISITVTPVTAAERAKYPQEDSRSEEYRVGDIAHYLFSNSGSITAVWYTENYFVSISGNINIRPMKRIIDSVYAK